MDSVRTVYADGKEFISSIIEWRSAATAPYFMLINTVFWWSVFYLQHDLQQKLLISLAIGVFSWDILLSSTHEHSILVHLLIWPIKNSLRTASVILALSSAYLLQYAELEKACWMAYSTLALLVLNPVWHYQRIPNKINDNLHKTYSISKVFTYNYVLQPSLLCFNALKYVFLLQWLPVVCNHVKRFLWTILNGVRSRWRSFTNSLLQVFLRAKLSTIDAICSLKNALVSAVCNTKNWIRTKLHNAYDAIRSALFNFLSAVRNAFMSLIGAIRHAITAFIGAIRGGIVSCIGAVRRGIIAFFNAIRNALIGTFGLIHDRILSFGKYIRESMIAIVAWIRDKMRRTRDSIRLNLIELKCRIRERILAPVKQHLRAFGRFLRFWLCAHWWPRLRHSFIEEIGIPVQKKFNYFCYYLVYVFCGHWIKPFREYVKKQLILFYAYLQRTLFTPFKRWLKARLNDLYLLMKKMFHKLGIAIRDSVIWPFCVIVADLLKQAYAYIHATVLQPVKEFLYRKYKAIEDAVYINVLGPACETIVNNIPEKSPFCEDSDVEFVDYLPQNAEDDEAATHSGTEGASATSEQHSLSSDDESEFIRGLKFPTVDSSESSDEEFELNREDNRRIKVSKSSKEIPKDPSPSAVKLRSESSRSTSENVDNNSVPDRLSLSSAGSFSDENASMSSTRSDALLNHKSSLSDSNNDSNNDVDRLHSIPSISDINDSADGSNSSSQKSLPSKNSMKGDTQEVPLDDSDRTLRKHPKSESRQPQENTTSIPRSTALTTSANTDELFEILDVIRR